MVPFLHRPSVLDKIATGWFLKLTLLLLFEKKRKENVSVELHQFSSSQSESTRGFFFKCT
jgi:hypothetical protein